MGRGTHPSLSSGFQCGNNFHLPFAQILTLLINTSTDGSKVNKNASPSSILLQQGFRLMGIVEQIPPSAALRNGNSPVPSCACPILHYKLLKYPSE